MHGKVIADLRITSQSSAPLLQSEAVPESDKLSFMCALVQCYENLSAESVDVFMFLGFASIYRFKAVRNFRTQFCIKVISLILMFIDLLNVDSSY